MSKYSYVFKLEEGGINFYVKIIIFLLTNNNKFCIIEKISKNMGDSYDRYSN